MHNAETAVTEYLKTHLCDLERDYNWAVPKSLQFCGSFPSVYYQNRLFKNALNREWAIADTDDEKLYIAQKVIRDWGGIKGNKDATLQKYARWASRELSQHPKPYTGVASYSKLYAIVNPNEYAIYDARVAVSLNAIQCLYDVGQGGIYFNYLDGRNNTTGHAGKKIGFIYEAPYTKSALQAKGWTRYKRDNIYDFYLTFLKRCQKNIPEHDLCDLEMLLFARAEKNRETSI